MDTTIVIFARAPIAGATKTRLIPALGARGAARLHRRMIVGAVRAARRAGVGPIVIACAPDPSCALFRRLDRWAGVHLETQPTGDLGQRMAGALAAALCRTRQALVMGTDCPGITAAHLRAVHALLNTSAIDAVVTPAYDGGYVLLGLKRVEQSIFSVREWSTCTVMADTARALNNLRWNWRAMLPLHDIDEPPDLRRLPPHLREAIGAFESS